MGNILKILVPVNYSGYWGMPLKAVHDDLINSVLFNAFGGVFEYFSEWSDGNNSFLGADNPEAMREAAREWNKGISAQLANADEKMRACMSRHDICTLEQASNFSGDDGDVFYAMLDLRNALCARTNHFVYGQDHLIFFDPDEYDSFDIWMSDITANDIEENPENWALIEVIYY